MSKVSELVKIAKDLKTELQDADFEVPAEVMGEWVSTLFINAHKPASPEASAGERKTVEGELQRKSVKDVNGKKNYGVQIAGSWYNTFNKDAFGGVRFEEGNEVKALLEKNKKGFWNLISLELLDAGDLKEDAEF